MQVIRAHRLEREADYAAQREQDWVQALAQEAQRHRSVIDLSALLAVAVAFMTHVDHIQIQCVSCSLLKQCGIAQVLSLVMT